MPAKIQFNTQALNQLMDYYTSKNAKLSPANCAAYFFPSCSDFNNLPTMERNRGEKDRE